MTGMLVDWGSLVTGQLGEGLSLQLLGFIRVYKVSKDVKVGCWRSGEGTLGFSH